MLFGIVIRYFGLIPAGIKAIVAGFRRILSIVMIEFPEAEDWLMLGSGRDQGTKDGVA